MKRLAIIVTAALLLVGCVSRDDVHLKSIELTGLEIETLTPKIEAKVSIENDSHTTINVSKIAFQLVMADGTKIADIAVPETIKIKGRKTTEANLTGFIKFTDPSILLSLFSGDEDAIEAMLMGLSVTGSARVKAGIVGKTMKIEPTKLMDLLEQME